MQNSNLVHEHEDLKHLVRVQALTQEVASAISAIERNDLRQFQAALAKQENLCHELVAMKWTPSPGARSAKQAPGARPVTPEVAQQIHEAYVALAQLNRVYAGVVKRSKRATELLLAVYALAGGHPSLPDDQQTVSCEV